MKFAWVAIVGAAMAAAILGIECGRRAKLPISPALANAIGRARAGLPEFRERLAHPQTGDAFFVRAELTDPQRHTEFLWLRKVTTTGNGYRGVVSERPFALTNVHLDESVSVPKEAIVDWTIRHPNGTLDGNFTAGLEPNR